MLYIYYLISHKYFPELIYIGSTKNLGKRKNQHKSVCYKENARHYHIPLYQFIRENHVNYDELNFEILDEIECDDRKTATKFEQIFIDQFNIKLNVKYACVNENDIFYCNKIIERKKKSNRDYYETNLGEICFKKCYAQHVKTH